MAKGLTLVDQYGAPLRVNGHRHGVQDVLDRFQPPPRRRVAELSYDAAGNTDEYKNYWLPADRLDADSANSPDVRGKLVSRSRYESGSNAYYDGLLNTYANYLIGKTGPKLRLQSSVAGFNLAVETTWFNWCKAVQFRRKLWCMAREKPCDGEALGVIVTNRGVKHRVKLDVKLVETEQCTTPNPAYTTDGYVDGIEVDEFGNPALFHILAKHPGSNFNMSFIDDVINVPAAFVLHWFQLSRAGQHRGVPEFKSGMNCGASSRRFREATVACAESAADINILLHTLFAPEEMTTVPPFTTADFQKRMIMALPDGYGASQMKSEHPNSTYPDFLKSQLTETGRPKSSPYNLTACDSSGANFASGKLDREPFYAALDVDREDGNDTTLDPMFAAWWAEAVREYGWDADPNQPPAHEWDWPNYPVADLVSKATEVDKRLRNGSLYLSAAYAEEGRDFEDELPKMANDYFGDDKESGMTQAERNQEMRKVLRLSIFNSSNQQSSFLQAETQAEAAAVAEVAPENPGDELPADEQSAPAEETADV